MALWNFASICLPYCLERQENGDWIALNREYKPLGFKTHDWIKYEQYPIAIKFKRLHRMRDKLHAGNCEKENLIFLYNDGNAPWLSKRDMGSYMARLSLLAMEKVGDLYPRQTAHMAGCGSYRKVINKKLYIDRHIKKYKNHCWYCAHEMDLEFRLIHRKWWPTIDHIEPLTRGGQEHENNYLVCCMRCNNSKGKKTLEEFRAFSASKLSKLPNEHKFYGERYGEF